MPKLLWGLALGPAAASFLDDLQPGKIRAQIVKKYKTLQGNPCPAGCKKLVGMNEGDDAVWRIRSGDYRILYVVREQEVVVIDIGHRKDIYK